MKNLLSHIIILLLPILIVIGVNEYSRFQIDKKGYIRKEITGINSNQKDVSKCSWACHNNTSFCQKHHVIFSKKHISKIDVFYFGIINSLKQMGDYGLMNIIFLVVLFPMIIYVLLIRIISIQEKIKQLKK